MEPAAIEQLLVTLANRSLVVVDEAYIEFSGDASLTRALARFPNLVVLRTLSKAFGLAGARVGSLIAAPEIVALLAKVIPPYSIPQLTIEAVLATLRRAAARHSARTRGADPRRTRAAARRACKLQARAEDLAQRRELPARRFRGCRASCSARRARRSC